MAPYNSALIGIFSLALALTSLFEPLMAVSRSAILRSVQAVCGIVLVAGAFIFPGNWIIDLALVGAGLTMIIPALGMIKASGVTLTPLVGLIAIGGILAVVGGGGLFINDYTPLGQLLP
jgi:hypothetical protein